MANASATPRTFQVPDSLAAELAEFNDVIEQFQAGHISDAQFRAVRVPMGIYEQRESGTYMLRVRLPGGGVQPEQLQRLADVAATYGNGILHMTTRQDIQVHRVALESIYPALLSLVEAGLSTKGGGGNTVRNITACYDSGICPREAFPAAPFAVALTERFMTDPLSFQLPRKYKVAFSGCSRDCAGATVNDVGFIVRQQNGVKGFAVYAGGGMGAKARVGEILEAFVPAADAFLVAEAIKRVFDKNGDRKNKHLARLRFLVERIGFKAFRQLYENELAALRDSAPAPLEVQAFPTRQATEAGRSPAGHMVNPGANRRWREANVTPQKQAGYFLVHLPLPLGDLPAEQMRRLAEVIAHCDETMICATQAQNLVLRWVAEAELPALYADLDKLGLAEPQPPVLRNLVACAGASTCRLGICLSRGLAKAITHHLRHAGLDLDQVGDLRLHISGCPNACGRHPVADIGFSGAARRIEGRLVPHYAVHLGGHLAEGQTQLAAASGTIPAKNVPAFLRDLLAAFLQSSESEFHRFMANGGRKMAEELVARHRPVPAYAASPDHCVDWDADAPFSLAGRGPGECSAGVFDLIEVDLASAREALAAGRHYAASALAARALLVTRGVQPKSDAEAFELFQKHFVAENLIERRLEPVIAAGCLSASAADSAQQFASAPDEVAALVNAVRVLYENMDASLRFKPVTAAPASAPPAPAASAAVHDFRGVACPLNYVKTKMALGKLQKGQSLTVLLDAPGAKNVPDSAAKDGHQVVSVTQTGDHWQVTIRRG